MEGLALARTVIAVVEVTVRIAFILKDYYESVRDARDDIQRLSQSIDSLRTVLTAIRNLNSRYEESIMLSSLLTDPDGPLQSISRELTKLEKELGPTPKAEDRTRRVKTALKWRFKRSDVEKILWAIERNTSELTLHFDLENLQVVPLLCVPLVPVGNINLQESKFRRHICI